MKPFVLTLSLMILGGCQMALKLPEVQSHESFTPIKNGVAQRKIAFAGGMFDLKRGDLYVAYPFWHWSVPNVNVGFYTCNPTLKYRFARSQGYWNEDDNIFGRWPDETGSQIESVLGSLGYRIKKTRDSFFENKMHGAQADLLLSMKVTDMKLNLCQIHDPLLLKPMDRAGGNGVVTVEWEIFDTIREKVLGSYITQGYGQIDEPLSAGDKAVFMAAVKNAAENLGRSAWFRDRMTTDDPVDLDPKAIHEKIRLNGKEKIFSRPIREHFPSLRKAIITVRADQDNYGSGFFINHEGYALTSARVVGDAESVQMSDANGVKYKARVLRRDGRRNVALIKADIVDNAVLPISEAKEYDLTETVYAIGTPFENAYRATITKGIIAANRFRQHENLRFIQASIPTTGGYEGGPLTDEFGNVIAISDSSGRDRETNFSLFIPIKEALKALNIELVKTER